MSWVTPHAAFLQRDSLVECLSIFHTYSEYLKETRAFAKIKRVFTFPRKPSYKILLSLYFQRKKDEECRGKRRSCANTADTSWKLVNDGRRCPIRRKMSANAKFSIRKLPGVDHLGKKTSQRRNPPRLMSFPNTSTSSANYCEETRHNVLNYM